MERDYKLLVNNSGKFSVVFGDEVFYDSSEFSWFKSPVANIVPNGSVTLMDMLRAIKKPKKAVIEVLNQIEQASLDGDEKTKTELKQHNLFYFTPCVSLSERRYAGISNFTGYLVAEFDKLGEKKARKIKKKVFNRFKSCICAFMSPSGNGCKFIFRIPCVTSVEEFKEYFFGLAYFLDQIEGFDPSAQSPVLPLFLSYDKDILIRKERELEVWTQKGVNIKSMNLKATEVQEEDFENNPSERDVNYIKSCVNTVFNKIEEEQTAHDHIKKISLVVGGYCGNGYMPIQDAFDFLCMKIEESDYCSKSPTTYKNTCWTMLNYGFDKPIKREK